MAGQDEELMAALSQDPAQWGADEPRSTRDKQLHDCVTSDKLQVTRFRTMLAAILDMARPGLTCHVSLVTCYGFTRRLYNHANTQPLAAPSTRAYPVPTNTLSIVRSTVYPG